MSSAWDNAIAVGAWAPKSLVEFENGACGKGCTHMESLRTGADHLGDGSYTVPWECPHGSWLMAETAPAGWTASGDSRSIVMEWDSPATAATCISWLEHRGCLSFGDITFLEDMRYYAAETPEVRAARKEAEALRDAADEAKVICTKVARKEEKWTNKGSMKFRVPRPCKYASLFQQRICAACGTRVADGTSSCTARVVKRPNSDCKLETHLAKEGDTGVRPCGEKLAGCWNHDQHKTCIYVHPDEPQWAAACAGTLRVKTANRLVFCMAGEEGPAAQPNRFSMLAGAPPQQGGQQRGGQQRGGQQGARRF
jgi:hypothetical protein